MTEDTQLAMRLTVGTSFGIKILHEAHSCGVLVRLLKELPDLRRAAQAVRRFFKQNCFTPYKTFCSLIGPTQNMKNGLKSTYFRSFSLYFKAFFQNFA